MLPSAGGPRIVEYPERIQFETNIDEIVDANVRQWRSTGAAKLQRRGAIAKYAAVATGSAFAIVFLLSGAEGDAVFTSSFIAIVLGATLSPFYGRLYDAGLDRRLRRAMTKMYGTSSTWICEIELRREGTWMRNLGVEILFPWSDTIDIADVDGAIELRFRGGVVVARDKAFATVDDRRKFIEAAHELSDSVQLPGSSTRAGNQVS